MAFITVIMFTMSFNAFAQNTEDVTVKGDDSKMHIKIEIEKDGKTTKVDTTIKPEDLAALNEQLKDLDIHLSEADELPDMHAFRLEMDGKDLEKRLKELHERLKDKDFMNKNELDEHLKKMSEKMKNFQFDNEAMEKHLEEAMKNAEENQFIYKYKFNCDSILDIQLKGLDQLIEENGNMNFNFNDNGNHKTIIIEGTGDSMKDNDGDKKIIIKRIAKPDDKNNKKESKKIIIIMKSSNGPEKEKSQFAAEPENETMLQPDAGNAKRVRVVDKDKNENDAWLSDLTCYPNPSSGEFTLSFHLNNPGPAELKIMDIAGREVFAENLPEYSGWVEKQIKLPLKSSAAYLLILRQGSNWHHEKIFVKS